MVARANARMNFKSRTYPCRAGAKTWTNLEVYYFLLVALVNALYRCG